MLGPSAHIDTFTRDNLPPAAELPDFRLAGFDYPERLNVAVELTDRMVQKGFGDNTAARCRVTDISRRRLDSRRRCLCPWTRAASAVAHSRVSTMISLCCSSTCV